MNHMSEEYIDEDKKKANKVGQAKCAACGAPISFDPETGKLKCEFCLSEFEIEKDDNVVENTLDLDKITSEAEKWSKETKVFHCSACGAETVFAKNEFAKECVFCSSPSVTEVEDLEGIRPNAVVPFTLTADNAKKSYSSWIKRKFFAPRTFKENSETENFFSIYCPSWTFDSQTHSSYKGICGDYYYVRVRRNGKTYMDRRIRYRPFSGRHEFFFDDIHLNSGNEIGYTYFERLKPFPLENAVVYSSEYLAGHIAEHYTVPLRDGWDLARDVMSNRIDGDIRRQVRADVIQSMKVNTSFSSMTYKYILLPVYVYAKRFKKKIFKFFVNGCTGSVAGKTPLSKLKIGLTALLAILGISTMSYFFFKFLSS